MLLLVVVVMQAACTDDEVGEAAVADAGPPEILAVARPATEDRCQVTNTTCTSASVRCNAPPGRVWFLDSLHSLPQGGQLTQTITNPANMSFSTEFQPGSTTPADAGAGDDWEVEIDRITKPASCPQGEIQACLDSRVCEAGIREQCDGHSWRTTSFPIADHQTVRDTATISTPGLVGTMGIYVDLRHTYSGDLKIDLISPTGVRATVWNRTGGGRDFVPTQFDLTAFRGVKRDGTWTLEVSDMANADVGTLSGWSLSIYPGCR